MQRAFEPISNPAQITLESLLQAYRQLEYLDFIPRYKKVSHGQEDAEFNEQAERFMKLDDNLREMTLDCVIAISKIAEQLRRG